MCGADGTGAQRVDRLGDYSFGILLPLLAGILRLVRVFWLACHDRDDLVGISGWGRGMSYLF